MSGTLSVFDDFALEYDSWFDRNHFAYQSEIEAVRRFIPNIGLGVEIGTGTGRFSIPFSITIGVEPSKAMAEIAASRGITVHNTKAEDLPFCSGHFDFALMITTLCFVDDPQKALKEAYRILEPSGQLILGILDKETKLGRIYESMKATNKFYREANFYSTKEVFDLLKGNGFHRIQTCQTIFSNPEKMTSPDIVKDGFGEGAFVVINSFKQSKIVYENSNYN
jgi:ubiquinone/menaquinone biosynthesis C-methylase UbiE